MSTYAIFCNNTLVRKFKSKKMALEYLRQRRDSQCKAFRLNGNRLVAGWDITGRELQFVSHGGDHGEWR